MPKISDEKRNARRAQILEAAWVCFQKEGLHATTMEDIIRASGLSAGAVYSYFKSKDELIIAAVTTSLTQLRGLLEPLLARDPLPDQLIHQVVAAVGTFAARDKYDLRRIALLGWSEAQRNERLRATMREFYLVFRKQIEAAATRWKKAGVLKAGASADDVAKTLLSLILGFVVQSAIVGDVDADDLAGGLRQLAAGRR
jgi:AcrR family transcriptional regulator